MRIICHDAYGWFLYYSDRWAKRRSPTPNACMHLALFYYFVYIASEGK